MSSKRAVFITGGSHGLGLFTARSLVAQGAAVALFARDKDRLDQARTDLLEDEPQAEIETFSGDVCDFESLQQSVQRFAESQGCL